MFAGGGLPEGAAVLRVSDVCVFWRMTALVSTAGLCSHSAPKRNDKSKYL